MKIAVLIYGRLNNCVQHYNNIINSIGMENNIDFFLSSDNSGEKLLQEFIDLYKPITYTNEKIHYDYDLEKYNGKAPETNMHNMICHFINKKRVFELLKNYCEKEIIHYDIIISLRVDIVFSRTILSNMNCLFLQ